MKKNAVCLKAVIIFICLIAFGVCAGCETVRGMGRDIKNADRWVKDHMW